MHTYFVGTLPRPYDSNVVSNTLTIDQQILEKTLEFAPGEWLLSSHIATGIENVPIFIRADNTENEIAHYIQSYSVIKAWLDRCNELERLNFNAKIKIKEGLRGASKGYFPISIDKLKEENKALYDIVTNRMGKSE